MNQEKILLNRLSALLLALLILCSLLPVSVYAEGAPISYVTTTEDSGSNCLRNVVKNAAAGTTIAFSEQLSGKEIRLDSPLDISKSLIIVFSGQTIVTASDADAFHLTAGTLTLTGDGSIRSRKTAIQVSGDAHVEINLSNTIEAELPLKLEGNAGATIVNGTFVSTKADGAKAIDTTKKLDDIRHPNTFVYGKDFTKVATDCQPGAGYYHFDDSFAPVITAGDATRTDAASAKVPFKVNEQCRVFWKIFDAEVASPEVTDSTFFTDCPGGILQSLSLTGLSNYREKFVYMQAVDLANIRGGTVTLVKIPAANTPYFSVTLPVNPTGYVVTAETGSISPVPDGGNFRFKVNLAEGYQAVATGLVVKANGTPLTAQSGVYSLLDIHQDQTVTVEGVEKKPDPTPPPTYNVTANNGEGYSITAVANSKNPVAYDGSFSFTVTIANGYQKSTAFAVKANGRTLSATSGVYTISNIREDITVSVSGVSKTTTTGGGGGGGGAAPRPAATAPTITTANLSVGTVGEAYTATLRAAGSTPITWSYTGTLPDGLTLNGGSGVISGKPTKAGTFRVTFKATNTGGSSTKQLTIQVNTAKVYTVTATNGSSWTAGSGSGITFGGSSDGITGLKVDGSTVPDTNLTYDARRTSATISPAYLNALAKGSHTVTVMYKDGSATVRFNIMGTASASPSPSASPSATPDASKTPGAEATQNAALTPVPAKTNVRQTAKTLLTILAVLAVMGLGAGLVFYFVQRRRGDDL